MTVKAKKARRVRAGTPAGYRAGMGGQRIRSKGQGRGLQRGEGKGPVGVPMRRKR